MYLLHFPQYPGVFKPREINPDSWRPDLQDIIDTLSNIVSGVSVHVIDESGRVVCTRVISKESSRGCPYAYC